MKPRPFAYEAPADIEAASAVLAEHGDDASVLAGGQSLLPLLNLRLASPSVLVDIGRIAGLRTDQQLAAGGCRLGSAVTHSAIEDGRVADPTGGLLARVAAGIGHRAIRNRGTLGGSLAHADPLAEWPLVLCALDAEVRLRSVRGERVVPVGDFVVGFLTTDRAADELCVAVDIPPIPASTAFGFCKLARKPGDFADAMAVAAAHRSPSGALDRVTLWLGALRERPVRLAGTERAARDSVGAPPQPELIASAVRADLAAADEAGDAHQTQLRVVAATRALDEALAGAPA